MSRLMDSLNFIRTGKTAGIVRWGVALSLGVVITFYISKSAVIRHIAKAQTPATPFTLTVEGYDFQESVEGKLFLKKTVAMRSDGATVLLQNIGGPVGLQLGDVSRKIQFTDGQRLTIFDSVATFTKWPLPPELTIARIKEATLRPPANCVFPNPNKSLVGHEAVMNHDAVMVRTTIGKGRFTQWRAPDLQCETLRSQSEDQQPDGSFKLVAEVKPISLVIGEPNPHLFEVPANYTSVTPSESMRREAARVGWSWSADMDREAQRHDDQYEGRPGPPPK